MTTRPKDTRGTPWQQELDPAKKSNYQKLTADPNPFVEQNYPEPAGKPVVGRVKKLVPRRIVGCAPNPSAKTIRSASMHLWKIRKRKANARGCVGSSDHAFCIPPAQRNTVKKSAGRRGQKRKSQSKKRNRPVAAQRHVTPRKRPQAEDPHDLGRNEIIARRITQVFFAFLCLVDDGPGFEDEVVERRVVLRIVPSFVARKPPAPPLTAQMTANSPAIRSALARGCESAQGGSKRPAPTAHEASDQQTDHRPPNPPLEPRGKKEGDRRRHVDENRSKERSIEIPGIASISLCLAAACRRHRPPFPGSATTPGFWIVR